MIYISGPIRENDMSLTDTLFLEAEEYLKVNVRVYEDTEIINSYTRIIDKRDRMTRKKEIIQRLEWLKQCDKIYMLLDWEKDPMARVEHEFASASGMRIMYSKKF